MGARPRDWHPVAEKDPIPGDPVQVAVLGKKLRDTADVLEQQIKNLKAIAEVTAWDSDAGKEFRKTAEGTVGKLEAAFKRYDAAADALGTRVGDEHTKDYASQLHRAQQKADAALKEAQEADGRKSAAQKSLDGLKDSDRPKDDNESKKKEFQSSLDAADGEVQAAKDRIDDAKKIRDDAAKAAKDSINNIIEHDSLKDKESFWGSVLETVKKVADTVATFCAAASLLVGWIPVIGQALAGILGTIAMIASLVSLGCTIIQIIRGEADLWDLGFAVLAFATLGVGKAFNKIAGKYASKALNRMNRAAGRNVRRDRQKLNKLGDLKEKLPLKEKLQSFKEPFADVFTKSGWRKTGDNFKTVFKPSNWSDARTAIQNNGGLAKSYSMADGGIAADLKKAKSLTDKLGDSDAVNKISDRVGKYTLIGTAITGSALVQDDNVIAWTGMPNWKEKLKSTTE